MILVTGATGMTGQFVVQELQQRNYPVRVLVRTESVDEAPPATEIVIGDLSDLASLHRATNGVTGIIHTACTFDYRTIDIGAMQALLEGWNGGPFIFISSLDVYGTSQDNPITETTSLDATYNDYALGKIVCESLLVEKAHRLERRDYAILRAPYIWGPHPKAYSMLVKPALLAGQPWVLPGADQSEWSHYQDVWIDVRDLARLTVDALEQPNGEPLNVLTGHFVWHDVFAEIIRLTGSASELVQKPLATLSEDEHRNLQGYAQTWQFSNERLQQMGFQPHYSLEETLAAVAVQHPLLSDPKQAE